jgi:hypothetical protein
LEDRCALSCTSLVLSTIIKPLIFGTLRFGQHSSWKNSLRRAEALTLVRSIQRNVQSITFHLYYASFNTSPWSGPIPSSIYASGTSRAFASKANAALLKALPKLPRLSILVLSVNHIPSNSWPVVVGLPVLNHLELYSADGATPAPLPDPLPESHIKSFILRYVDYTSIVNALLKHLGPSLEALQLIYRSSSENMVTFSFPPFPMLSKFTITGSREPKMPHGALVRLLIRSPAILHLEMNPSFNDNPLPETILPNLQSIALYSVTDPFNPIFASPRSIRKLIIKMTGEAHTEQSTKELLSAISENVSAPSISISGPWSTRWAVFDQLQWSFRELQFLHLQFIVYFFPAAPCVSPPTSLPHTLKRITIELRDRVQGCTMAQMSPFNHYELRGWPEALITAEGNEGLKEIRLEVWRIGDRAVISKDDDEPEWWKKVWRVEGADGGWRMDTSSGQGFHLDEL